MGPQWLAMGSRRAARRAPAVRATDMSDEIWRIDAAPQYKASPYDTAPQEASAARAQHTGATKPKPVPLADVSALKPRWTDAIWIAIFLIVVCGFVVIAGIDLSDYTKTRCFRSHFGDPRAALFDPQILAVFGGCILAAVVISSLYYSIAAVFTQRFIVVSMFLQMLVSLGSAIFYLAQHRWLTGAFNVVWALGSTLLYWFLQSHIASATAQLQVVMRIAEKNPTVLVVSIAGALLSAAWCVLVTTVTLAGFAKAVAADCSVRGKLRPESEFLGLLIYLAVANNMMAETIKAIVRAAICQSYGFWYYGTLRVTRAAGTGAHEYEIADPDEVGMATLTWSGVGWAVTYSLGSLCFAGFWLAVARVLAQVLAAMSQLVLARAADGEPGDVSVIIIAWMFSNCVSLVDVVLSHFTNYVIVHIAVYNQSYIEGAQSTIAMVGAEGMQAVVNDCLAGGTLTFGSWCVGTSAALLCYCYMRWLVPYPVEGVFFVSSYVTLVGVQIASIFTTGISSGVQTLFVCSSHDPHALQQRHPRTYEQIRHTRRLR